ncbi:MAG TPA: acyltransferase [Devosia sp.]|nr:acyltransferase [Devosia sp.]
MTGAEASTRVSAMDGLRGWAALSVVIFHFTWEMFGHWSPAFRSYIPAALGSAQVAVAIFFTLSGYVLTIRRWRRADNPPYLLAALRRYLRLTIPILTISFCIYLLMVLGLTPTRAAAPLVDNDFWLGHIAYFDPSFLGMLVYALARAYWVDLAYAYHPFLWTMIVELWGSLIVFAISQGERGLREPYTAVLLCIAFFFSLFPLAACFFLGALVALLQRDGVLFRDPPTPLESKIATAIFIAGVFGAAWMHLPSEEFYFSNFKYLTVPALTGVAIVFAAIRSVPVSRLLTAPASQVMGRLSFPLYLMHGLIAASFAPALILWTASLGPLDQIDAWLIALASILASVAAAPLLLPVEQFTLGFVRRLQWPFGRRPATSG